MLNYIPEDFYTANKSIVYTRKDECIKVEGSAIGFDSRDLKLSECTIINGELVADAAKVALKEKETQVRTAYDTMTQEIYSEMKRIFGTTKSESAAASVSIWEAMLKRPENYVDVSLGLTSAGEVTAYANTKLAEADAYGLFILKRRAQFTADKEAILNA